MVSKRTNAIKRYALLINEKARQGAQGLELVEQILAGASSAELVTTEKLSHDETIDVVMKRMLALNPNVIIIGGGDGTISTALDFVITANVTCAILPLGTTNNFARTLGIPLDLEAAVRTALDGKATKADIGKLGDDYFPNVVSVGLSSRVARVTADPLKRLFGRAAYGISAFAELLNHRPLKCRIEADGKSYELTTHQLVIANGKYHSAVDIGQEAGTDTGLLTIFTMDDGRRRTLVRNFKKFHETGLKGMQGHTVIRAQSLTLATEPRRYVEVDGEVGPLTPVTIECVPKALSVMVPR